MSPRKSQFNLLLKDIVLLIFFLVLPSLSNFHSISAFLAKVTITINSNVTLAIVMNHSEFAEEQESYDEKKQKRQPVAF